MDMTSCSQRPACSYLPFRSPLIRRHVRTESCVGSTRNNSYYGQSLSMQVHGRRNQLKSQRRWGRQIQVIRAAIFGVGAPEALLVGVVALVVFGPKGLAQAVKSLGATLRTFSPTIRELASVTNDLSSTLQEQIGLDDIRNEFRNPPPNYYRDMDKTSETPSSSGTDQTSPSKLEGADPTDVPTEDLEAKIAESKRMAWAGEIPQPSSEPGSQAEQSSEAHDTKAEAKSSQRASELSIDELEAELKRRRNAANGSN